MKTTKYTAVVLAAGSGSRMKSNVKKQFMDMLGKPLIYYALKQFEESAVEEIILVTGEDAIDYCREEIIEAYGFTKVAQIVAGGKERYNSVYNALKVVKGEYVLIHDGARAFIDQDIIDRAMSGVEDYKACVIGMPVKDTIKVIDENGYAVSTPNRSTLWQVQTPQCFVTEEILTAYEKMMSSSQTGITDDAMVMEQYGCRKIKLLEGSYNNLKMTTPEDILVGEMILKNL
ncbi:MAG: 2-C-methyl-D-erythritol 4-phosphate cytidylyltransferase [Lachnospiraceae bacterium]|nr:2-C-methyl-D-erythritol 4-phosphate cytidylyltransferase [Lachnospiraceae bacterium]